VEKGSGVFSKGRKDSRPLFSMIALGQFIE